MGRDQRLPRRRAVWRGALAAAALALMAAPASAQDTYPRRAVEIVVPFAAGGSTDLGARIFAEALQARWDMPVKVVNRPGGNTVPGVQEVMTAAPDGHTILMDGPGSSSMLDTVVRDLPFKATDRTFISLAAQTPLMLIVGAASELKSLDDVVAAARKDPAGFSWTSGPGTTDMTFRRLFQLIGVDHRKTRPVQVRGGSEAVNLVAGGHVRVGVGFWGTIAPLYGADKLRIVAVAGTERFPELPDVPTAAEAGVPDLEILQWIGFSGPPGLPAHVVAKWTEDLAGIAREPKVVEGLKRLGLVAFPSAGSDMQEFVETEQALVKQLWAE